MWCSYLVVVRISLPYSTVFDCLSLINVIQLFFIKIQWFKWFEKAIGKETMVWDKCLLGFSLFPFFHTIFLFKFDCTFQWVFLQKWFELPSPVSGDELFRVGVEAEDLLDGDGVDHREWLPNLLSRWLTILDEEKKLHTKLLKCDLLKKNNK